MCIASPRFWILLCTSSNVSFEAYDSAFLLGTHVGAKLLGHPKRKKPTNKKYVCVHTHSTSVDDANVFKHSGTGA